MKKILNTLLRKWPEYFLEIMVIIIGILGAFALDNWNENRKELKEEIVFKQALNEEFRQNRAVLKVRINDLNEANAHVRSVLDLIENENITLSKSDIDSILSKSLKYGNYNPANSTIQELISSGKLKLLSEPGLKNNLFIWLQLLEDANEDFKNQDQQASMLLIPYLYKNLAMKDLNNYNNLGVNTESKLYDGSYEKLFNKLEFENLYSGKLFWNTEMLKHYQKLDSLAIEIINQSETSIP